MGSHAETVRALQVLWLLCFGFITGYVVAVAGAWIEAQSRKAKVRPEPLVNYEPVISMAHNTRNERTPSASIGPDPALLDMARRRERAAKLARIA